MQNGYTKGISSYMRFKPRILGISTFSHIRHINWERIFRLRFMAVNFGKNTAYCNLNHGIPPGRALRGSVVTVNVHYPSGTVTKTGIVLKFSHNVLSSPKARVYVMVDSPTNPTIFQFPLHNPIVEISYTRLPSLQRRRNILYCRYRLYFFREIIDRHLGIMGAPTAIDHLRGVWPPPRFQGTPVGRPPERFVRAFARCSLSLRAQ